MSLAINTTTPEGIVLAADSRQSYRNRKGMARIGSDNASKLFQLNERIGVAVTGLAFLTEDGVPKNISKFIEEFKRETDVKKLDVRDIAEKLYRLFNEKYKWQEQLNNLSEKIRTDLQRQGCEVLEIKKEQYGVKFRFKDPQGNIRDGIAGVDPIEANIKIKDDTTTDLSEQFLISCNVETPEPWSCAGGLFAHDYHWNKVTASGEAGAVAESEKPYSASNESCCSMLTPCPFNHSWKLTSWSCVAGDATPPDCCRANGQIVSTCDIKRAIMRYGPVSAAVCVGEHFQDYTGGVFETDEFCPDGPNHAIVLTGWDDTQGNNGVWFLRNSWGSDWGERGYMRIGYGISAVGSCANYIVYQRKGDEIGVFQSSSSGGYFSLDMDNSLSWTAADRYGQFGTSGDIPIVGDWDSDGTDDVGVFQSSSSGGYFSLDMDNSLSWTAADRYGQFGTSGDIPIVGDWDSDGTDDVGVFQSSSSGGYFSLDMDNSLSWTAADRYGQFGTSGDIPIVGNWAD